MLSIVFCQLCQWVSCGFLGCTCLRINPGNLDIRNRVNLYYNVCVKGDEVLTMKSYPVSRQCLHHGFKVGS